MEKAICRNSPARNHKWPATSTPIHRDGPSNTWHRKKCVNCGAFARVCRYSNRKSYVKLLNGERVDCVADDADWVVVVEGEGGGRQRVARLADPWDRYDGTRNGRIVRVRACACAGVCVCVSLPVRGPVYTFVFYMYALAANDEQHSKRQPVNPELMMECDCEILKYLSSQCPPSKHRYSTTIMASFFEPSYLKNVLSQPEFLRLMHIIRHGGDANTYVHTKRDQSFSPR